MELITWPLLRIRCIKNSLTDPTATFFNLGAVTLSLDQLSLLRSGSGGKPPTCLGCCCSGILSPKCPLFRDLFREALSGYPTVHALAAGVGDRHGETRRDMSERHGCGDLIHVLASWPGRTGKAFREIFVAELNGFHGIYSAVP